MKYPPRYTFDSWVARLRRNVKQRLPGSMVARINRRKQQRLARLPHLTISTPPWSSPNVWQRVVDSYTGVPSPRIFEYGMGSSSLHHFSHLLRGGGEYEAVELSEDWLWEVARALQELAARQFPAAASQVRRAGDTGLDIIISAGPAKAILKLRNTVDSYVKSFDSAHDTVIVDGAYRQACVDHVLASGLLKPGNMLVLMEAGRGSPGWWEGKLFGANDYTTQLRKMIESGGQIVDGNGIDQWPGYDCHGRSPAPVSYCYPLEACFLQVKNTP